MGKKAGMIAGATFALPLLSPAMTADPIASDANSGGAAAAPTQLTENEMDNVTAGLHRWLPTLPTRPVRPGPELRPIWPGPIATTLALGEEGGVYPYPVMLEAEPK